MTTAISITAILISIAAFIFSIIQFKKGNQFKLAEKTNELLHNIYNFQRKVEDLKIRIGQTDGIPDFEDEINLAEKTIENILSPYLQNKKIKAAHFFSLEQRYMALNLEFDLLIKQIDNASAFNKECTDAGLKPIQF